MKRLQLICLTSIIAVVSMMGCQGTKGTSYCEDRSDDFACSDLDVAVSFNMLMLRIDYLFLHVAPGRLKHCLLAA